MRIILLLLLFYSSQLFSGTPTMDGTFDGTSVWGVPVATSTGAGWQGVAANDLYTTNDANYVYFAATLSGSVANWMSWAFVLNTTTGGGSQDSWSRQVFYNYALPDYTFRGTFGNYSEYHTWTGSWSGLGTSIVASERGVTLSYVEIRVPRATFGGATTGDLQFYITGDNNNHGSFEAVPNDDNSADWNPPLSTSNMVNYALSVALPVKYSKLVGYNTDRGNHLEWATESEINNSHFEIERSSDGRIFKSIGEVEGLGNASRQNKYEFTDEEPFNGINYYRLKQVDFDDIFEYSSTIAVRYDKLEKLTIYPNPAKDRLFVSYKHINDILSAEVVDIHGRVVFRNGFDAAGIDISNLNAGDYFARFIEANGNTITERVIID